LLDSLLQEIRKAAKTTQNKASSDLKKNHF